MPIKPLFPHLSIPPILAIVWSPNNPLFSCRRSAMISLEVNVELHPSNAPTVDWRVSAINCVASAYVVMC